MTNEKAMEIAEPHISSACKNGVPLSICQTPYVYSVAMAGHNMGRKDGILELIGNLKMAGFELTENQLRIARELIDEQV